MTTRLSNWTETHAIDQTRRMANICRIGSVDKIDEANARLRVRWTDDDEVPDERPLTDWIPWVTVRAGPDREWWIPEIGEQVVVLCPSGELNQAVVLGSIFQNGFPANGKSKEVHRQTYKDGVKVEYARGAHVFRITKPTLVKFDVGDQVCIIGDLYVEGTIYATKGIGSPGPIVSQTAVWPLVEAVMPVVSKSGADGGIPE